VHTNYGPNAQASHHELLLHVWFENFSTPAARAVHEIQIPFKVAVRSVCDQTKLNRLRAD